MKLSNIKMQANCMYSDIRSTSPVHTVWILSTHLTHYLSCAPILKLCSFITVHAQQPILVFMAVTAIL
jgi:hypothetical protein